MSAQPPIAAAPAPLQAPQRNPIPWWVHLIVWVVVIMLATALGFFVLMMSAFACDSGAAGCADVAGTAIVAYGVAALLLSTAPLLVAALLRGTSLAVRVWRIITLVLIIVSPLLALAVSVAILGVGLSRLSQ